MKHLETKKLKIIYYLYIIYLFLFGFPIRGNCPLEETIMFIHLKR